MLQHHGFNETLYPNEENALMDDIQKHGGKLLYDPNLFVYRRPRSTLKGFAKMLMTYGRGRAEQFRVNPTFGSALNFVPPLFVVYLLSLPIVWAVTFHLDSEWLLKAFHLPLFLYALAVLLQTIVLMPRGGIIRSLCALPLTVLTHVLYGVGFWRGLFTRLEPADQRSDTPVTLERIAR
jgi:hypothetical protein